MTRMCGIWHLKATEVTFVQMDTDVLSTGSKGLAFAMNVLRQFQPAQPDSAAGCAIMICVLCVAQDVIMLMSPIP
jgi:hypothetical protein